MRRPWSRQRFLRSVNPSAPTIRIDFADFWPGFNKEDNYFTSLLLRSWSLNICDDPDVLIFSCFGHEHERYHCMKIFYTGENVRPDFSQCDYAFTFDHLDDRRHFRLPLYAWWDDPERLIKPEDRDYDAVLRAKSRFCNFIYGNANAERRLQFLERLSRYKPVDCAGTLRNNVGRTVNVFEKVEFIRDYKFTIAFENESYPGYTTEKLVHPMLAENVAIYWGNPVVHLDFNPSSFVNVHDFDLDQAAVERIIELDQNDALYVECLAQPFYHGNIVNRYVDPRKIHHQFATIFDRVFSGRRV
jgi:hypothetical protein